MFEIVAEIPEPFQRFFRHTRETVETVSEVIRPFDTQLKLGENEKAASDRASSHYTVTSDFNHVTTPRINRSKCPQCGLVNAAADETCRRCQTSLSTDSAVAEDNIEAPPKKRHLGQRIIWICGMTLLLLFVAYMSLLLTSDELGFDRRQIVHQAIAILRQKGFTKEAFVLDNLVKYRGTDNWWNRSIGHHDAYAATNFPFEVVTLYPEFFSTSVDDTERAAILLHESHHLFGAGEEAALEAVWREKQQLGWTADKYAQTKVWNNTRELTAAGVPKLFQCGPDGHSDCVQ